MKQKLIFGAVIILLMVILPCITIRKDNVKPVSSTKIKLSNNQKQIKEIMYYEFREEYTEETLKAVCVLIQTNCKDDYYTENHKLTEEKFKDKYKESSEKHISKIQSAMDSVKETEIKTEGKKQSIPYSYLTWQVKDNKHLFLKNCATPWDKLHKNFSEYKDKTGISLNTLNQLCKNGYNYKEALEYFFIKNKVIIADSQ